MGKTAAQSEPWGSPEFGSAKDLTSWWTAALAMPYLDEKFTVVNIRNFDRNIFIMLDWIELF